MPLPLIIGGIASALSAGISAGAQSSANKASMAFQTKMYDRQRADALSDYDRNNAYNSPLQQMIRFKEAGLNPNLIYGQTSNAAPVRSSSPGNYKAEPVDPNIMGHLLKFIDLQMSNAQISNQEKLLELRSKEADAKDIANKISGLNLSARTALQDTNIEIGKERLRNLRMDTVTGWNKDNRDWTKIQLDENSTAQQIEESKARIRSIGQQILASEQAMRESQARIQKIGSDMQLTQHQIHQVSAATANLLKDGDIKAFEIKMNENYINKGTIDKVIGAVLDVGGSIIENKMKPAPFKFKK